MRSGPSSERQIASRQSSSATGFSRSERPRREKQTSCPSGWTLVGCGEQLREGAVAVGAEPLGESGAVAALVVELLDEVAQERRRPAVGVGVVVDAGGGVAGVGGAVEGGELGAGESAGEQLDQLGRGRLIRSASAPSPRVGGRSSGLSVTASGPASGR